MQQRHPLGLLGLGLYRDFILFEHIAQTHLNHTGAKLIVGDVPVFGRFVYIPIVALQLRENTKALILRTIEAIGFEIGDAPTFVANTFSDMVCLFV